MKKWVLITGANSDLACAIAKTIENDFNLILNYHKNNDNLNVLIKDLTCEYLVLKADITKEVEVKELFNEIKNYNIILEGLINNAAFYQDEAFNQKSIETFKRVVDVNLAGTFLISKYAGMMMLEQKNGRIINISSTNGIDTENTLSMDYDASKAGVISLTKNFANALAPYILVNCIAPGWIETKPVKEMNPNDIVEEKKKILLNRFAEPQEIANVVSFLLSEKATYINGSIIRVDGGKKC